MVMVLPILSVPQGIWLKIGINGGRLWKEKSTMSKLSKIKINDMPNAALVILSVRISLKNSFIN